eukprot:gnl/TRDRNA2_/TRDRNA2_184168_c0_seq1.p1 gnl/TRDRNA2_/TRDRNA2_184168_c0~~gnl/TRDRNA2_/TRDRNA2_184168_c0_seq1.p1  ORF type:complete len:761 (-),score=187.39 gnl/TRDRNA2_/TRDRNA2_184168_c0_seq1:249-2531(-)
MYSAHGATPPATMRTVATPQLHGVRRSSAGSVGGWSCGSGGSARKDLVKLPDEFKVNDPLIGVSIRKSFGTRFFVGRVHDVDQELDTGAKAYHIVYEDGDEEHMSAAEVQHFSMQTGFQQPAPPLAHSRPASLAYSRPASLGGAAAMAGMHAAPSQWPPQAPRGPSMSSGVPPRPSNARPQAGSGDFSQATGGIFDAVAVAGGLRMIGVVAAAFLAILWMSSTCWRCTFSNSDVFDGQEIGGSTPHKLPPLDEPEWLKGGSSNTYEPKDWVHGLHKQANRERLTIDNRQQREALQQEELLRLERQRVQEQQREAERRREIEEANARWAREEARRKAEEDEAHRLEEERRQQKETEERRAAEKQAERQREAAEAKQQPAEAPSPKGDVQQGAKSVSEASEASSKTAEAMLALRNAAVELVCALFSQAWSAVEPVAAAAAGFCSYSGHVMALLGFVIMLRNFLMPRPLQLTMEEQSVGSQQIVAAGSLAGAAILSADGTTSKESPLLFGEAARASAASAVVVVPPAAVAAAPELPPAIPEAEIDIAPQSPSFSPVKPAARSLSQPQLPSGLVAAAAQPQASESVPTPQVGLSYVGTLDGEVRVMQVVASGPSPGSVTVMPCTGSRKSANAKWSFKKEKVTREILASDLRTGPFQMLQAGRVPPHIEEIFDRSAESQQSAAQVARDDEEEDDEEEDEALPPHPAKTKVAVVNKHVVQGARFKYSRPLNKLKDMGFEDNPNLRQILMNCEGNLQLSLQYLTSSM